MDVVLVLHSHIPYVLHHGRWPHGSDWICEAAVDSYLPLLDTLLSLSHDHIAAPLTIGFTPVLASQLANPEFQQECRSYLDQRIASCAAATSELTAPGDQVLLPIVAFWQRRYGSLRTLFEKIDGDLPAAFRALEDAGRIEITSSAATHGFLPLLSRAESVTLQLLAGRDEHERIFGRSPRGCWVPECAYSPGLEGAVSSAGYQYFFTDAHMVQAGQPVDVYADAESGCGLDTQSRENAKGSRSPYQVYRAGNCAVLVRDPVASRQVWSRYEGYPGDHNYLEFHKIRWPGGLRLWQVSAPGTGLGEKRPYRPEAGARRAGHHARHFVSLLMDTARTSGADDEAIVAPFDTELFGHWWFEGPYFLRAVFEALSRSGKVRASTASATVMRSPETTEIQVSEGSWGARGDFSMWNNPKTAWTWKRLRILEQSFWNMAPEALAEAGHHHALKQATRELLLAQSSDWQFIISTGAAAEYAEQRFIEHCAAADALIGGLLKPAVSESTNQLASDLAQRDQIFPGILTSLAAVLERRGHSPS